MTSRLINGIVGAFEGAKYPGLEPTPAIPSSHLDDYYLARKKIHKLPGDLLPGIFARDTMSTWFRLTGVGLPSQRFHDQTIKTAIELSSKNKLREYGIQMSHGKTARAKLMDHIFKEAIKASTPEQTMEIISAMHRGSNVPYIQSLSSRFYSWGITALNVVKLVTGCELFKWIAVAICFSSAALKWHSWFMFPILNSKTWLIFRPFIWVAYLYVGYIGLSTIAASILFISFFSVIQAEALAKFIHKRAETFFLKTELREAYITWMKATEG